METNQAGVSPDPETALTAIFEKAGYKDEPQVEEPDEPEEVAESDGEPQTEEASSEETPEVVPEEAEEVEYEGKSYKLPKELKDALLRQQDYTRKTQEVAEKRKFVDEQAQSVQLQAKFHAEHFAKAVEAQSLHTRMQQFAQVDWAGLAEQNPAQYLQLDRQYRELQEANNRVQSDIRQLGDQFRDTVQADKQKAQARCIEELKKDFKDFGPELLKQLDDTGRHFGFSGEELAQVVDPRLIRVLHAATQYRKLQGKTIAEKKVPAGQPAVGKTARTTNSTMQTAKLNEMRSTLKKTGRAADAEALLTARFARSMR